MKRHFRNALVRGVVGMLALSACADVSAQEFPDWVNPCGTPWGGDFASPKFRLANATAFLVQADQLIASGTPGYRKFAAQPAGGFAAVAGTPVLAGSPFYGEKRMSASGRTGYLVSPDIVVTASHGGFNHNAYAVVFGVRAIGGGCPLPDFDLIPEANIAFPPHGDRLLDPANGFPAGVLDYRYDYFAFKLQQPRTDRSFIRMRRTGEPEVGEVFMHASYPERMSMKVYKNVLFERMHTPQPYPGYPPVTIPLFSNYALMDGSSGGPMYNLSSNFVETSVGSSNGLGCLKLTPGGAAPSQMLNDCGPPSSMLILNNGSLKAFANALPAAELLVSPLGTVTQKIPLGAVPPQTNFQYELRVHAQAPAAVNYAANVEPPPVGQPSLLTMANTSGTLAINSSIVKNVALSAASVTTCGVYQQEVTFLDVSHGYPDRIRHRLEVGLTDYALEAPASPAFQGVVSPYLPAQLQYTLRNTRPSPTQVKVANNTAWVRVDGLALPPSGPRELVYTLAAQGSPGDSATVTVTLDTTNANALAANLHVAGLSFQNLGACPVGNSGVIRTLPISFDKRHLTVETLVYEEVPQSTSPTPLANTASVAENFCVSDIEVRAKYPRLAVIGSAFMDWRHQPDMYLTAPNGTRRMIWNHLVTPANWPYDDGKVDVDEVKIIRVNRSDRVPPGSMTLNDFVGIPASGNWTLQTYDSFVDGWNGFQISWDLKLTGTPGACP